MASNSANINKANNHLSPQTVQHKKKKITTYGVVGNPEAALGQAHTCGGVKIELGQVFIVIKYSCHGSLQFMSHYRLIHDSSIFGKKNNYIPSRNNYWSFSFSFFSRKLPFFFSLVSANVI